MPWGFRIGLSIIALATLAIAGLPSSAAEPTASAVLTLNSPSLLEIITHGSYEGDEASSFRAHLDGAGNRDGLVNATEVRAAEAAYVESIRKFGLSLGPPGGRMLMDNLTPTSVLAQDVQYSGAEGPVMNTSSLSTRIAFHLAFAPKNQTTHELRIDPKARNYAGRYLENITDARVVLAHGYRFNENSWLPAGARFSSDGHEVTLPGGLNPSVEPFRLIIDPEKGGSGTPSLNLEPTIGAVLLACFLSAASMWRRQRLRGV